MAVLGDGLDRLALAVAEGRVGAEHGLEVAGQVIGHGVGQCGRVGVGAGAGSGVTIHV